MLQESVPIATTKMEPENAEAFNFKREWGNFLQGCPHEQRVWLAKHLFVCLRHSSQTILPQSQSQTECNAGRCTQGSQICNRGLHCKGENLAIG